MPLLSDAAARCPQRAPLISPLADAPDRPLWSVMIPAYNCAPYLVEAIASVLAQDPGPAVMQIQVVDDASTDTDVQRLVAQLGGGRVEYFRQPANVGSLRNFETCLNRSRGQLIHLLHADDRVLPGFYQKMGQFFQQNPAMGSAASHYACINDVGERVHLPERQAAEAGILPNWLVRIAQAQCLQYASTVVRRSVYEKLGGFYGPNYGEDWEMWVRIARHYPVGYLPDTLAEYRNRNFSISWERTRSARLVPDLLHAINRIQQHLPAEARVRVSRLAREYWACATVAYAYRTLHETKNKPLARRQLQQAFLLSHQPAVYYTALKFLVRLLIGDKNALKIKPFYQALRRPQMLQRVAWAPPVAAGVVATTPSPWGKPHYQQAAWAKVGLPV